MMAAKSHHGNERLDAHLRIESGVELDKSDSSHTGCIRRRSAVVIEHPDRNHEQN
jgi:hypothetical protein